MKSVGEILSFLFFFFPFFDFPKDTQGRGKTGGAIQGVGARVMQKGRDVAVH
jgi:hypothetical protein